MIDMRIDISRIQEETILTMAVKVIGVMTATSHEGMTTVNRSIVVIGITMTESIHLRGKTTTRNHTRKVVIKKIETPTNFGGKMIIAKEINDSMIIGSRNGIDNFNMNPGKGIRRIFRILSGKMVRPKVLRHRIATYAEKTVIMQINAPQKKKGKHRL